MKNEIDISNCIVVKKYVFETRANNICNGTFQAIPNDVSDYIFFGLSVLLGVLLAYLLWGLFKRI